MQYGIGEWNAVTGEPIKRAFRRTPERECERGDSNPHPVQDQILSLARLPIPPLSLFQSNVTGNSKIHKRREYNKRLSKSGGQNSRTSRPVSCMRINISPAGAIGFPVRRAVQEPEPIPCQPERYWQEPRRNLPPPFIPRQFNFAGIQEHQYC